MKKTIRWIKKQFTIKKTSGEYLDSYHIIQVLKKKR